MPSRRRAQHPARNCRFVTPVNKKTSQNPADVELWVIQTAGAKRWRCYAPLGGFELPSQGSGDLPQARAARAACFHAACAACRAVVGGRLC
jgi:hypothetical protein